MMITFSQLEAATAEALRIPSARRTAMQAHLRNFQKIGLVNVGRRGTPNRYSLRQAFELLLATALNLDGMKPTYIKFLIEKRRDTIHRTAEAGRIMIFHPEGALHDLRAEGDARHRTITLVWAVGQMRADMMKALQISNADILEDA